MLILPVRNIISNLRREILVAGAIPDVENKTPNEVGGESSREHNHQYRQALPQRRRAMIHGDGLNGIAGGKPIGEAGAHNAGKSCYKNSALQVEFFDGSAFL